MMNSKLEQAAQHLKIFSLGSFPENLSGSDAFGHYKQLLKDAQEKMDAVFVEGGEISDLIYGRAWVIDQVLNHIWEQLDWGKPKGISLIAVGGYGRGELHPHSDIDLLILYRGYTPKKYAESIEKFLTTLWDIGLKVGHSVRSIRECKTEAKNDITVATAIMEARTLAGDEEMLEAMQTQTGPNKIWPSHSFFRAKRDERSERHRKFKDTEYNLEPNIKSSPGGLRDVQVIAWVAKRHSGGERLHDLVGHGFLTESEFESLNSSRMLLWKIRYGLHMITGRAEDRLLFDHQRALAEMFGFEDQDGSLAIEQLMQECYRAIMHILILSDVILQHFDEAILRAKEKAKPIPLNPRFNVINDYIEVANPQVFLRAPYALIEIFQLMAYNRNIKGIRASTIRLINSHRHLIDDEFRADIRNTSLFMDMLKAPSGIMTQLQRMRRYGVLGRYLPEFGRIIGQMQHDLFHIYTVDAHTLLLLQYVRRIYLGEENERFPVASKIVRQLPKMELIYIACLYHDIAKGRGGDHSELGAVDAREFCQRHLLPSWDAELVAWLVQSHLLMSMTAQSMDISDPQVIQEFAATMGDQIHLDYLFILTIADINATNPTLWNSWRASLLRQLYFETREALARGLHSPLDVEQVVTERQQQALALIADQSLHPRLHNLWQDIDNDYFYQHSPEQIARHCRAIVGRDDLLAPVVTIDQVGSQDEIGGTEIMIFAPQAKARDFAIVSSVLEKLHLNVVDARINLSPKGFSLNTCVVLDENGLAISDNPGQLQRIHDSLMEGMASGSGELATLSQHTPRRLQHFSMPSEVRLNQVEASDLTAVTVIAPDRPGMLALISRIFLDHQLLLQKAKIATLGERVEDTFYVTTEDNLPLTDSGQVDRLQKDICQQLDDWIQGDATGQSQQIVI